MSDWQQIAFGDLQTRVRHKGVVPPQSSKTSVSNVWPHVALTKLVAQRRDAVKIESGVEYRLLGVRWYGEGAFHRETVTRETSKATTVHKVVPGQFIYNRLFAGKGSFGLVLPEFAGAFVSKEFPLFDTDTEQLSVEYLNLYFQQRSVWDHVETVSTGTTASRNRWKESQFLAHHIPLPPLPVQERIVELIGAVDDQVATLDAEARTTRRLLNLVLSEHFAAVVGKRHRIVDLCSHVVGGVWGKPEGEGEVDRLALGPRIYAPGTSDFVTDGSPVRSFTAKQASTRTVREQDIILERSGGSPEQPVGRAAIAGPGLAPCVPTDFQRLMRVNPEKALPKYVFWRLRHDWVSGLTRNYSRRTTGITNLSVKEYIAREIHIPSPEDQAALVESAEAVDALIITLRAEAASLRQVRSSLLSGLLDRAITIDSVELEVS